MPREPIRVDCLARELPGRIALVAGGIDGPDHAVQICRDLHEVLESGDYRLRLETEAPARREAGFTGRPIAAKFPGRCAVCQGAIAEGERILYDREARKAAHERCGEVAE